MDFANRLPIVGALREISNYWRVRGSVWEGEMRLPKYFSMSDSFCFDCGRVAGVYGDRLQLEFFDLKNPQIIKIPSLEQCSLCGGQDYFFFLSKI